MANNKLWLLVNSETEFYSDRADRMVVAAVSVSAARRAAAKSEQAHRLSRTESWLDREKTTAVKVGDATGAWKETVEPTIVCKHVCYG